MVTLCFSRSCSRPWSANDGRCVEKFVALALVELPGWLPLTGVLVAPVMASPVLVTLLTLPVATWSLKALYGITTVVGCWGPRRTLVTKMFATSSPTKTSQKRRERIGLRGGAGAAPAGGFGGVAGGVLVAKGLAYIRAPGPRGSNRVLSA